MARRYVPNSSVSYRLEEAIDVPFKVVATPAWIEASLPSSFSRKQIIEVGRPADLDGVRNTLLASKILTMDTESSGPRERDGLDAVSPSSDIVCGQIGTRKEMLIIEPGLFGAFRPVIESPNILKILQHAVHDFRFVLSKSKMKIIRMFCTMLAEQVLTAGKEGVGVGLSDLVRKYSPHHLISKNVRDDFITFKGTFTEEMLYYAARDVFLLFPVFDTQKILLKHHTLEHTAKREFNIIPGTAEMGLVGVYLDDERLWQTVAYFQRKLDDTIKVIFDIYNAELKKLGKQKSGLLGYEYETFNLKSHSEKRAALKRIGLEIENTEYETMIQLDHPIGKPMADLSGYVKVLDNYGESLIGRKHWHTGRVHPNFDQLGAGEGAQRDGKDKKTTIATGRFSSNFQQLPRPEHLLELVEGDELEMVLKTFGTQIAALQQPQSKAA